MSHKLLGRLVSVDVARTVINHRAIHTKSVKADWAALAAFVGVAVGFIPWRVRHRANIVGRAVWPTGRLMALQKVLYKE